MDIIAVFQSLTNYFAGITSFLPPSVTVTFFVIIGFLILLGIKRVIL